MRTLFSPYRLSGLDLSNRIVMAPMTRSRALGNVPNSLMASYYAQRASAGMIVTEGTSPSPNGLGYARIPGIFSEEQVKGWQLVTDAVHKKGGKIFVQLMHTGRVAHPANLPPGGIVMAPSAVKLQSTKMWVDSEGLLDIPAPAEMTAEDIEDTIDEFVNASLNAMRAGFDGVELHGANGYLIKQFLNPNTNQRADEYGGTIENRARFLLQVTKGLVTAIGKDRIGIRLSPYSNYNEMPAYDEADATYLYVAQQLNILGIAYLHISDPDVKGEPHQLARQIRQEFENTIILSGGYDVTKAEEALSRNEGDLVAFARPFIANPDLTQRFKNRLPLNQLKHDLFYTAGKEGYTDYPVFEDVQVIA